MSAATPLFDKAAADERAATSGRNSARADRKWVPVPNESGAKSIPIRVTAMGETGGLNPPPGNSHAERSSRFSWDSPVRVKAQVTAGFVVDIATARFGRPVVSSKVGLAAFRAGTEMKNAS